MGFLRILGQLILFLLRVGIGGALLGGTAISLAALFGRGVGLIDALNHFQIIWALLLTSALIFGFFVLSRRAGRDVLLTIGLVGLLASAVPLAEEWMRAISAAPIARETQDALNIKVESRNLFAHNSDIRGVANGIIESDPDILVLQEYFGNLDRALHPILSEHYPYFHRCHGGKRAELGIYAKFPFDLHEMSTCPKQVHWWDNVVGRTIAQFEIEGRKFSLATTHLNWPVQISKLRNESMGWPARIAETTARKELEWAELVDALAEVEGDIVLLGDFNATPWTQEIKRFQAATQMDRHTLSLPTYPAQLYYYGWRALPQFLPLDHIFSRGDVGVSDVEALPALGSDHLGLGAQVTFY